jgi:hypothetical protein
MSNASVEKGSAAEPLCAPGQILGMFAGMALAAFGVNLVRLPAWARERERQMEALAEHAVKLLSNS